MLLISFEIFKICFLLKELDNQIQLICTGEITDQEGNLISIENQVAKTKSELCNLEIEIARLVQNKNDSINQIKSLEKL